MIEIIKELNIEVSKPNVFQAVVAKQYDMNTRFIKATFVDSGDKIYIDPNATVSVVINAVRPDGVAKGFEGKVNDDGTVTVPLHSWMLELDGTVVCDISVIDTETNDNKKLTTTSFTLVVEKAAYGGDDITSDPQYDILLELIERVENLPSGGGGGGGGDFIETDPTVPSWAKQSKKPTYTADEVGADPKGIAERITSVHDSDAQSHNDIRLDLKALADKINAFLDSDDTTLDELTELIVAIKNNQGSISQLTSGKVNVTDIINNLTTNVTNKPLSAAQGVALKALIDAIRVPTKVSELTNDSNYLQDSELSSAINTALAQAKESGQFDGADGKDGTSVTVTNVTTSSADGGSNVVTFSDGKTITIKNGSKGSKGDKGDTGAAGTNGTNGKDGINGINGKSAYEFAQDGGYKGTVAEFSFKLATDYEEHPIVVPEFANSIEECVDKTKLYVLPDGFYYAYMQKSVIKEAENLFKASESTLNAVMGSSSTSAKNGYVWSNLIPIDLKKASPFVVRVKGTKIATDTSNTQKLWLCDSAGAKLSASILYPWRESAQIPANNTNVDDDGAFWADYKGGAKVSDSIINSTKYIRVGFAMNSTGTAVTVNDLANVSITFDIDNVNETVEGWFSTGLAFNQPADYSEEVEQLRKEVTALQNANVANNTPLNKNTCSIFRKVVCCGDSLTAGYINIGQGVSATNEDYAWPHYMSLLTGNEYINCGSSGANVFTWQERAECLAKARATGKVQAYIIGLGVNDSTNESALVPIGTVADIGTNNQTYYGGMSKLIRELNAISPKAKIFVQTMPGTTSAFLPYNQAVRDICEAYKTTYPVHCLDLYAYLSLYRTESILNDSIGGHRTAIGYQQFAENLRVIWSEYINTHISDFQDVYLIPID